MFISLKAEGVKVTASKMIGKHECSERKHRNNYHILKLGCEHADMRIVGGTGGMPPEPIAGK
jgi:hypothetical protein